MHSDTCVVFAQAHRDAVSHAKLLNEQVLPAVGAAEAACADQRSLSSLGMHSEISLLVTQARRDALSDAKLLKEQLLPASGAAAAGKWSS